MEIEFDLLDEFIKNMNELVKKFEKSISLLENDLGNKFVLNELFRAAHSIKGMAATMEYNAMENLTHKMEDLCALVRENTIDMNVEIVEIIKGCYEQISILFNNIQEYGTEDDYDEESISSLINKISKYLPKKENTLKVDDINAPLDLKTKETINEYIALGKNVKKIEFRLSDECAFKKTRGFMGLNSLAQIGEIITSRPLMTNLLSDDFSLNTDLVVCILETSKTNEVLTKIITDLTEIENVKISDFLSSDNLVISHDISLDKPIVVAEQNFDEELFIGAGKEIVKICEDFEFDILNAVEDENDSTIISDLLEKINISLDVIEMYNDKIVSNIYLETKKIVELTKKGEIEFNSEIIDLLLDSLSFIKTICEKGKIKHSRLLLERVTLHLENLADIVYKNVEKSKARIGEFLKEKLNLTDDEITELLILQKEKYPGMKLGEIAVREKKASSKDVVDALRSQSNEKLKMQKKSESSSAYEYIKIPATKADNLLDILEEIITVQSILEKKSTTLFEQNNPFVQEIAVMERLIKEVQNISISFRMVSLKLIFQNVKMTVKDTLKKVSKHAKFEIKGEDTEIDRVIANRLLEPLQHLLKNSIAHGIEDSTQDRIEKGKNEEATIGLRAYSEKGYVFLEVSDDGRGINIEKVYSKAVEKKLVNENKNYTAEDIVNFIFLPGFSTADTVDNISGRGVGMDVVKTEISKLGGKITTVNTPGKGCKFILKVPKNMTAMNGTVVNIYGNKYIIPTFFIREIYMTKEGDSVSKLGEEKYVKVRNELIPIMNAAKIFNNGIKEKEKIMIVLDVDKKVQALPVYDVLEKIDIVVKPLGEEFENLSHFFGAAILGDGTPSLIINVENLYKVV